MRKYLVIILALFMALTIHSRAYSAVVPVDGDEFSTTNFRIDGDGGEYYKSALEVISTNDTVTAAESGKVFVASTGGAYTSIIFTLPAADTNLVYKFIQQGTGTLIQLKPNGTDQFLYSTATASDHLLGPATAGASITINASDDSVWFCETNGTFSVITY